MWTHTCTNTHAHKGDALNFFEHTSDDTTCSTSIKTWWVLIPAHSIGPAPWSFARLNAVLLPLVAWSRHIRSQKYRILTIQQAPNWPTISVCAITPHVMSCISSFQFCNPKLLNDKFGNSGLKLLIPQQHWPSFWGPMMYGDPKTGALETHLHLRRYILDSILYYPCAGWWECLMAATTKNMA